MSTKTPVLVTNELLAELRREAQAANLDVEEYVEESLRRDLARRGAIAALDAASKRSGMDEDQALRMAFAERDAMRAERREARS